MTPTTARIPTHLDHTKVSACVEARRFCRAAYAEAMIAKDKAEIAKDKAEIAKSRAAKFKTAPALASVRAAIAVSRAARAVKDAKDAKDAYVKACADVVKTDKVAIVKRR